MKIIEKIKNFCKDKKNLAIVILSALLLLSPSGQTNNTSKIDELTAEISSLRETISTLEKENQDLKQENSQLQASTTTTSESTDTTTTTDIADTTEISDTSVTTQPSDNDSEMVWVGNTGTKYHRESCRTLKGNGHQITMKQALSEGKQACKVCY